MTMIKLSKCNRDDQIFFYNGETVGLQYILKMIYNCSKLPEIKLCKNDEAFNNAVSSVLQQVEEDVKKGINRKEYGLIGVNTKPVKIDITKTDIDKIDNNNFQIKIK